MSPGGIVAALPSTKTEGCRFKIRHMKEIIIKYYESEDCDSISTAHRKQKV